MAYAVARSKHTNGARIEATRPHAAGARTHRAHGRGLSSRRRLSHGGKRRHDDDWSDVTRICLACRKSPWREPGLAQMPDRCHQAAVVDVTFAI